MSYCDESADIQIQTYQSYQDLIGRNSRRPVSLVIFLRGKSLIASSASGVQDVIRYPRAYLIVRSWDPYYLLYFSIYTAAFITHVFCYTPKTWRFMKWYIINLILSLYKLEWVCSMHKLELNVPECFYITYTQRQTVVDSAYIQFKKYIS